MTTARDQQGHYDEERLGYCLYVYQFRQVQRYLGAMPAHLMHACDTTAVERLFKEGLLAFVQHSLEDGRTMHGVILTDKGLGLLEAEAQQ